MLQASAQYPDSPHLSEKQLKDNISRLQKEGQRLHSRSQWFAAVRIGSFLLALILLIFFANERLGLGIWLVALLFPPLFAWLVNRHGKLRLQLRLTRGQATANQNDIYRLKRKLNSLPGGETYLQPNHPYAADLDVFGKHSLFALLNRTATAAGASQLASWLTEAATVKEIRKRQQAVAALQPAHAWRHRLEASGVEAKSSPDALQDLYGWFASENLVLERTFYKTAFISLPLVSLALLLGYFFADWSFVWVLLAMGVNGALLYRLASYTQSVQQATQDSLNTLDTYTLLIQQTEESSFSDPWLQELQARLTPQSGKKASDYLRELSRILHGLDSRSNVFYQLLNLLFLLDLYWLRRAERWKMSLADKAPAWLAAIHTLEAISSLAGFAALEPEAHFPELSEANEQEIAASALAHPLLLPSVRVANDFSLKGRAQIALITGSNMAGKSTFLRTVGLNTVLGLSGAPVCAQQARLSRMQLFTSMRTQDSLEESASAFYAELRRIQQLLSMCDAWTPAAYTTSDTRLLQHADTPTSELPVFFLLDEVLKGTNSRDRHLGAAALIRQLQKAGGSGLVSTHDLSLGQLHKEGIRNFSFNSFLKNNELVFPYRLEEGLCHSFNASQLMARMGIDLPEETPPTD